MLAIIQPIECIQLDHILSFISSARMHERVIVSLCLSVCLSVADLEDGGLLAFQRGMNLNWTMIYVPLICHFLKFGLEKVK